jgi:hypothetical protein
MANRNVVSGLVLSVEDFLGPALPLQLEPTHWALDMDHGHTDGDAPDYSSEGAPQRAQWKLPFSLRITVKSHYSALLLGEKAVCHV